MEIVAYITGGGPLGEAQLPLCVYGPTITMALSWLLIHRSKKLVWVAVGFAIIDSFVVLVPYQEFVSYWLRFYESPPRLLIAAPWVSVLVPFVAIIGIYNCKKKTAEPGATDNPDDAQHLREDH